VSVRSIGASPRTMGEGAGSNSSHRAARETAGIGERAVGRVFVSPRVLDENAFNEFSAKLRDVLDEAADRAAQVAIVADEAAAAREDFLKTRKAQRDQMEIATKLLKVAQARCEQVEQLLTTAEARLPDPAELQANFQTALDGRLGAMECAMRARLAAFDELLASRVVALDEDVAAAGLAATQRMDAHAETLADSLAEAVDAARDEAASSADSLRATIERKLARESSALEGLLATAAAAKGELRELLGGDGETGLASLRETCARAERLAGWDSETNEPAAAADPRSLRGVVERAERARREAEALAARLTGLVEDAQSRAGQVTRSVNDADVTMTALEQRKAGLERSINEARKAAIRARAELSEQASAAESSVGPVLEAIARAESLGTRVHALLAQCQTLSECAEPLTSELTDAVDRGEALARTLADWRPLLIEADGAIGENDDGGFGDAAAWPGLPPQLARIAESFRAGIAADLEKMASAMHLIAGRAKTEVVRATGGHGPGIKITAAASEASS
jgi:hypothetical protein